MPDFLLEEQYDSATACGLDEAGRGPLAGPVVAACVYVPHTKKTLPFWNNVNDSKKISAQKREDLFKHIIEHCHYGIAEVSVTEIDKINILQASLLAMKRSYEQLTPAPSIALIDGNKPPLLSCKMQCVIKGDSKSLSIAAASILAKVTRDNIMKEIDQEFPCYGWYKNAGYGTKQHIKAIKTHGITDYHRKSFAPIRQYLEAA